MSKYSYQKFLLNCDYDEISLSSILRFKGNINSMLNYGEAYCLLDLNGKISRKIDINELDSIVDTESDWNDFIESLKEVDELVIYSSMERIRNPIIMEYREATLKAYLYRLINSQVKTNILLYS